ncbi:MAG TPA: carboxymuconolactone decarboxylase family protein [Dehalococcoidia bacterium]|nr:carboxymuconolactone decarboxylase family protein [Dehalococcoidia bacterium]
MSRVRLLEDEELDPGFRKLVGTEDELYARVIAHRPELVRSFSKFYLPLRKEGLLDARLKELVRLRIADINKCAY